MCLTVLPVAVVSSGTAAVSGFGIGSRLMPLLALQFGMNTAVAAGAQPQALAAAGVLGGTLAGASGGGCHRTGFGAS